MTEKELIRLLRKHKDAPELGGGFTRADADRTWLKICDRLGWDAEEIAARPSYTAMDYAQFYWHSFSHLVVRPAAVGFAALVLVLGGWTTSVNASHAIPGDVLYPVKLASENVRIRFASPTRRTQLHVQYADRRLREVAALSTSGSQAKPALVKTAVANFNKQIASINADLEAIRQTDAEAAVALATIVDRKVEEYESVLAKSAETVSEEVQEVQDKAIETLVTSHEETDVESTRDTLKHRFQDEYSGLKDRIALSFGRLDVIEGVLAEREEVVLDDAGARIDDAREAVALHDKSLRTAMDTLAAGGYRRAFEILAEVEAEVARSEAIIIGLELEITTNPSNGPPGASENGEIVHE